MEIQPVELTGKQAKLIPMEKEHVKELFEAGNSEAIWPYMPMEIKTEKDMGHLVEDAIEARQSQESRIEFPVKVLHAQMITA